MNTHQDVYTQTFKIVRKGSSILKILIHFKNYIPIRHQIDFTNKDRTLLQYLGIKQIK